MQEPQSHLKQIKFGWDNNIPDQTGDQMTVTICKLLGTAGFRHIHLICFSFSGVQGGPGICFSEDHELNRENQVLSVISSNV